MVRRSPHYLGGLTELQSDDAAWSLGYTNGYLHLNGLKDLSSAAAEDLSKHQGTELGYALYLEGLTELTDAAAEHLGRHAGDTLDLSGLTELSDAAA